MSATDENRLQRLAYSIEEAAYATSIGRTTLYSLINAGSLKAVKIGGRTIIAAEELERLIRDGAPVVKGEAGQPDDRVSVDVGFDSLTTDELRKLIPTSLEGCRNSDWMTR